MSQEINSVTLQALFRIYPISVHMSNTKILYLLYVLGIIINMENMLDFRQRFPDVQLFLKEMTPDQVVRGLHDQQIDVGLLYLPLDDSELNTQPILREPLIAVLPGTHPQATQPEVALQALSEERFIVPS